MHPFVVSFAPLLLAHLLADFLLQSSAMIAGKRQLRVRWHLAHAAVHALLAYGLLGIWDLWRAPLAIAASHWLIDMCKEAVQRIWGTSAPGGPPRTRFKLVVFFLDQIGHGVVLALVSLFLVTPSHTHLGYALGGNLWLLACLYGSGLVAAIWMGGVVIGILSEPLLWQIARQPNADSLEGFPNSGQIIGWLERFLIFILIVQQQYIAVGFLVTAKSILRFGEIRDSHTRMETEYVLIGTMLSFAWGIGVALLTAEWVRSIFQ